MIIDVNELQKYIKNIFTTEVKTFYYIKEIYNNLEYCFDIHCEADITQKIVRKPIISLHIDGIKNDWSQEHIYNINTDYNTDKPSKEILYILNTYFE